MAFRGGRDVFSKRANWLGWQLYPRSSGGSLGMACINLFILSVQEDGFNHISGPGLFMIGTWDSGLFIFPVFSLRSLGRHVFFLNKTSGAFQGTQGPAIQGLSFALVAATSIDVNCASTTLQPEDHTC